MRERWTYAAAAAVVATPSSRPTYGAAVALLAGPGLAPGRYEAYREPFVSPTFPVVRVFKSWPREPAWLLALKPNRPPRRLTVERWIHVRLGAFTYDGAWIRLLEAVGYGPRLRWAHGPLMQGVDARFRPLLAYANQELIGIVAPLARAPRSTRRPGRSDRC